MKTIYLACSALVVAAAVWGGGLWAQEFMQLGPPVRAAEPSPDLLPFVATPPPHDIAVATEVVVVSGYEPARGKGRDTSVRVLIDRPGSKVFLVLTSYDKALWKVDATPTTTVAGIVVSGHHEQTVASRLPTRAWRVNLPFATDSDRSNYLKILAGLRRIFSLERIDAFRASYAIPARVEVRTLDQNRPQPTVVEHRPQTPRRTVLFTLMADDFVPVRWSLTGPLDKAARNYPSDGKLAVARSVQQQFRLVRNRLETSALSGESVTAVASLPPNFPELSWPMDIAYDTRRDIVAVVSLGGEGFLYRFDVKNRNWVDFRSMRDIDVVALSYDHERDRYVGWTSDGSLVFIDVERGTVMSRRIADRLIPPGSPADRRIERSARLTIVPTGDDIILIQIVAGQVQRIWHYDVKDDFMEFTYSADQTQPRNAPSAQLE